MARKTLIGAVALAAVILTALPAFAETVKGVVIEQVNPDAILVGGVLYQVDEKTEVIDINGAKGSLGRLYSLYTVNIEYVNGPKNIPLAKKITIVREPSGV